MLCERCNEREVSVYVRTLFLPLGESRQHGYCDPCHDENHGPRAKLEVKHQFGEDRAEDDPRQGVMFYDLAPTTRDFNGSPPLLFDQQP